MADSSLQFQSLTKSFPGVRAFSDVTFTVHGGKVHALMGENGAGKSTLLKILSGLYQPDAGELTLDGQPIIFHSTAEALRSGIAVIYQELQLVPELSVAENLYLGHLPSTFGMVKKKQLRAAARAQLAALGEDVDPRAKVGSLPIAQRQMIEIAKAFARDARVIAFDEPTSSLSSREVEKLFAVIERLRAQGRVILYVTHRMEEVYRICDAATVLRDGRHVETFPDLKTITADVLVNRMVGRDITDVFHYTPRKIGAPTLEIGNLYGPGLSEPASFYVSAGEIVGIFGLVGAGRTELLKLIYGATRSAPGSSVCVDGQQVSLRHPADAIASGIVLCPEDRKKEGIIPIRSVMENMNLSSRRHFSTLGFIIRAARERANASKYVSRLSIKTPSLAQLIMHLSGGNQQKVILGRWLGEKIRVILLDEPTRGIDVGAKSEIYSIIYDLAKSGVAVVVVSSELPEVLGISDRILVMRQGKIVAELDRSEAGPERVLNLALPVASESVSSN